MNAKSTYCFTRITSRSGLGASPRIQSISCTSRANWSASIGFPNRGGREELVKDGRPSNSANAASVNSANSSVRRSRGLAQETRGIAGKIGQDEIRAGPADRGERLHHD